MIHVWYHSQCYDGFGAAYAAWKAFKDSAVYVPCTHGKPMPEVLGGDMVYIVDFSFPRSDLLKLYEKLQGKVKVLDHHESAEKDLKDLDFALFDMKRSGAGITWDYFHSSPRPKLIDFIEDRDLWKFKYPESHAIHNYLKSFDFDFQVWDKIAADVEDKHKLEGIKLEAEALVRAQGMAVKNMCVQKLEIDLKGVKVICCNATSDFSEVPHLLLEDNPSYDVSGYFCVMADKTVRWGLRSNGKVNVATLAKQFGGGGHANAAGFVTKSLAEILDRE